ncbi:hypothetical protein GCM10012320_24430 [Sinomonas cellulolyticus]|uniref:Integral membrane protein n=1 Tax=Sinomonas cellulolyticus TaxID=2801916 RepID=A0ABS1K0E1_9MICC|nr:MULTISPECIES: hypothetical protein [Sinomonas]MBL0704995.1 hypothetical protein [Sinomonas cellulolyticus]GHG53670.1 hypothetical protein GCM10012320_24430 [Sinomonas sp. KCTC 49339]
MTWLAWVTFGVALVLALVRIPAALRGQSQLMLWLFALLAGAVLLSIEGPYLAIDHFLGGFNLANLLLRFLLYGITLLLAVRIAQAFGARGAQRVLLGPWGLAALGVVGGATVCSFVLLDPGASSVGLHGEATDIWFTVYSTLGRVYPGFTGVVLLPCLFRAVRRAPHRMLRAAALLLAAGYTLLALTNTFTLLPPSAVPLMEAVNYSTLLLILSGLATIWIGGLVARRRAVTS